jgi:hypothetical protein
LERRSIRRISVLIFTFFMINLLTCGFMGINSAQSADLLSSYNILKTQYPEYINRMVAGGATETQIESFLVDLDANVRSRGELTEANFDNVMYEALQEVIQYRKHRAVFRAMLSEFEEEIDYTLENGILHPNLVPLRNAVKDSVLGKPAQDPQPGDPNNPGGGGITNPDDQLNKSILDQLNTAGNTITVSTTNNTIGLKGDTIQQVTSSGKNLEIKLNSVKIIIPPGTINIAGNLAATINATVLGSSAAASSVQYLAAGQQLLGSVYEINCVSQTNSSGLNLEKAVTVTLSYSAANVTNINQDLLDIYYYDENKKTWVAMNGKIDKDKKTITFTTTHFSKYAIVATTSSTSKNGSSTTETPKTETPPPSPEPTTTGAEKFTDLKGHWAAAEVGAAVKLGIASGMSPTRFAPDQNITRAQFATLLTRAIGLKNTASIQSRFNDVTADAWYFDAVNSAAEAGLVSGYSPTTFGPNDLITREQMAIMIRNALSYKNKQVNSSTLVLDKFTDRGQISSWALPGVITAVDQGIITGRSANTIAPRQNATRAEGTAMILRMYKLL